MLFVVVGSSGVGTATWRLVGIVGCGSRVQCFGGAWENTWGAGATLHALCGGFMHVLCGGGGMRLRDFVSIALTFYLCATCCSVEVGLASGHNRAGLGFEDLSRSMGCPLAAAPAHLAR